MSHYPFPGFIPPWQDAATLCAHLCISDSTLDNWVRQKILPPGRMVGGKRMWKWSEIEHVLDSGGDTIAEDLTARIYHATKKAISNG